ncbi:MAG: SUMF1/EgtB/PvdO family nonheme iron enzyme [Polyangiaceae bacterium]
MHGRRAHWGLVLGTFVIACQSASASTASNPGRTAVRRGQGLHAKVERAPCPREMVLVSRTCVDRWEAHLAVAAGSALRAHPHTERPRSDERYLARSAPSVHPQAYISRPEAEQACSNAGKRLCTLGEWYRACRGSSPGFYPWGARDEAGRCNTGKPHLLGKLFGRDPRRWSLVGHFNSPRLNAEPGYLALTGEYSRCGSDLGTVDMVGNLHEWVSDVVDPALPSKLPLRQDILDKLVFNQGHAIFMGGFYSTTNEHGEGCGFLTPGHEASVVSP